MYNCKGKMSEQREIKPTTYMELEQQMKSNRRCKKDQFHSYQLPGHNSLHKKKLKISQKAQPDVK